jgi:hypothetical protein
MWTYPTTPLSIQFNSLLFALIVVTFLTFRPEWMRGLRKQFRRLANRPYVAALTIASLSMTLSLLLAGLRFPLPWIHDEYSYLLASDTFSHFRLSNPPHPLWQHFESFHVLSQPTYASKYPPGQGLALAVGQLLTGYPIVGVWLSLAAACVAIYWMLRSWTSAQWALLGGLAITIHAPIVRSWGQSYWGGAVAMLGGALVYGALRRIWQKPQRIDASCLAVGLLLLANTRPAEGFLASVPVFVSLFVWFLRDKTPFAMKLTTVALPVALIGSAGLGCMAVYNRATTGSIKSMAYQVHDKTYSASSLLIWKKQPEIPQYNHSRMRDFYLQWGRERALQLREPKVFLTTLANKFHLLWDFFPLGLGFGLLALPWLWRQLWLRLAISTILLMLLVQTQLASSWMFPHYLAPIAGIFYAVNVSGLRRLYVWQRNARLGKILTRGLLLALILKLGVTCLAWTQPIQEHLRERIAERLVADSASKHLVIVSYSPKRSPHKEYVYNDADIDGASIVWARDMGATQNERLIQYFAGRKVWRWHLGDDDTEIWEEVSRDSISGNQR